MISLMKMWKLMKIKTEQIDYLNFVFLYLWMVNY